MTQGRPQTSGVKRLDGNPRLPRDLDSHADLPRVPKQDLGNT